jgi:mono/diheme cytochrome c family protein
MHYRRHCLHCHGLAGDGRGPTGPWVSPHPRDYRQGLFKFISTRNGLRARKPRRQDLLRTLHKGIDGTSMPSFGLLPEQDLEQLVSYVIHLSIRGEVEFDTLKTLLQRGTEGLEGGAVREHVADRLGKILAAWQESTFSKEGEQPYNQPGGYPYKDVNGRPPEESIRRGYALFTDTKSAASCINCHIDYGRQVPFRYDDWGTLVRPANLTAGVFRGGRRPLDLFWRIKGGIPPSGMPEANLNVSGQVNEYWDLVNFVQALPYPSMLPQDIRDKIYGTPAAPSGHASAN